MDLKKYFLFFAVIYTFTSFFYGCEIKEPVAPSWDIGLNLPFTNKSYNIFDIIKLINTNKNLSVFNKSSIYILLSHNNKFIHNKSIKLWKKFFLCG